MPVYRINKGQGTYELHGKISLIVKRPYTIAVVAGELASIDVDPPLTPAERTALEVALSVKLEG